MKSIIDQLSVKYQLRGKNVARLEDIAFDFCGGISVRNHYEELDKRLDLVCQIAVRYGNVTEAMRCMNRVFMRASIPAEILSKIFENLGKAKKRFPDLTPGGFERVIEGAYPSAYDVFYNISYSKYGALVEDDTTEAGIMQSGHLKDSKL